MAKKAYIGIKNTTINMLGSLGDLESGTVYKDSTETNFLKNSSQYKFGSSSQTFQQSASGTLTYKLRDSSGVKSYAFNNTHKYYVSIWVNQRTNLTSTISVKIGDTEVISKKANTTKASWQQHSAIYTPTTTGNQNVFIVCNNYPGSNAAVNVDGFMIVDITECFNDINPDKDWYDENLTFTTNTSSDSTSVAKKVKKIYVGVSNISRKVKKGYIGIGGVARPFWTGGELAYYGPITSLARGRSDLAATQIGNYALFGGGENSSYGSVTTVDAYNTSLVRSTPTALSASRMRLAATTVGNYALFGGGAYSTNAANNSNVVDAYNAALTRTTPTALGTKREELSATSVGNYALFAGGYTSNKAYTGNVDAYNTSLTRSSPTGTTARTTPATTTVGNYALFAGGHTNGSITDIVHAYNTSLTRTVATKLDAQTQDMGAATVGNYAIFAGGQCHGVIDDGLETKVYAYNSSLTRTIITSLTEGSQTSSKGVSIGDYALLGFWSCVGRQGSSSVSFAASSVVYAYDTSLTQTKPTEFSEARTDGAAAVIGNYALFAGGDNHTTTVEAYTI